MFLIDGWTLLKAIRLNLHYLKFFYGIKQNLVGLYHCSCARSVNQGYRHRS